MKTRGYIWLVLALLSFCNQTFIVKDFIGALMSILVMPLCIMLICKEEE